VYRFIQLILHFRKFLSLLVLGTCVMRI